MIEPEELARLDPLDVPLPPRMVKLDDGSGLVCERCGACCYHWFIYNVKNIERSYVVKCKHLLEGNICEVYDIPEQRPVDCATHWCERLVDEKVGM